MSGTAKPTMATGSINLAKASTTLACVRVKDGWERTHAFQCGRVDQMSKQWHAASRTETEKGFMQAAVTFDTGTIVCLSSQHTRNRVMHAQGALFLRLRTDAPMLQIRLTIPTDHSTILGDHIQAFMGNADVLSLTELRVLGVSPPKKWWDIYGNQDEIDELFTVRELVPGRGPRPTFASIATSSGVTVVEVARPNLRVPRRRGG